MDTLQLIISILILILALGITVMVLMQNGKQKNLSGAIAGGSETFLGKERAKKVDKVLDKATMICAIAFAVLVLFVFIIQPSSGANDTSSTGSVSSTSGAVSGTSTDESADVSASVSITDTSAGEASTEASVDESTAA